VSRSYQFGALVAGIGFVFAVALVLPIFGRTAKKGIFKR